MGWAFVAGQFILLAALVAQSPEDAWAVPGPLRTLGVGLRVLGALAMVGGAIRLGRSLTPHPEPTGPAQLRTDGAYRLVRHPIYAGLVVFSAAIALAGGGPLHLLAFVALTALLVAKARFEERLLRERFPGYAAYAARTGRFVPRRG